MLTKRPLTPYMLNPLKLLKSQLFLIFTTVVLVYGWSHRDDNYLEAETGIGYTLGIVGGSLMLILLLYPISKRVALFTRWIPIRYWFGIHMLFGIVGPVMILFHSNFHLGSTNSSIALICMLLVASSGLIGRYIYTHIHHGLYGARITLKELKDDTENNHLALLKMYNMDETLNERLTRMESRAMQESKSLAGNLIQISGLAINAKQLKRKVVRLIKESGADGQALPDDKSVVASIENYTLALRRAAAFRLYERLFSLWHILHLPLFIMMIIAAVIHIFAVHMY